MIKALYLVNGLTTRAIGVTDEDIAVDAGVAAQFTKLNLGDWAYLIIENYGVFEVIRVERKEDWYEVTRAQDGTQRGVFAKGAKIYYKLTSAEIMDRGSRHVVSITADGYGGLTVLRWQQNFCIKYDLSEPATLGGISAVFEDNGSITIQDNLGAFGCCDSTITGAPSVSGVPFYLTSQLYATEAIEEYVGMNQSNNGNVPPLNIDDGMGWWLLTQPQQNEKYVGTDSFPFEWELYGGSKTISTVDGYTKLSMGLSDWELYGGAKDVDTTEEYVSPDAYVLLMELFGDAIVYDRALDKYVSQSAVPLDWTIN